MIESLLERKESLQMIVRCGDEPGARTIEKKTMSRKRKSKAERDCRNPLVSE
jgi:hypothetical protein